MQDKIEEMELGEDARTKVKGRTISKKKKSAEKKKRRKYRALDGIEEDGEEGDSEAIDTKGTEGQDEAVSSKADTLEEQKEHKVGG